MQTHSKMASTDKAVAPRVSNYFKNIWDNMKSDVQTRVQAARDMYDENIRGNESRERMSSLAALLSAGLIGWAGTKVVRKGVRQVRNQRKLKNTLYSKSTD